MSSFDKSILLTISEEDIKALNRHLTARKIGGQVWGLPESFIAKVLGDIAIGKAKTNPRIER